MNKLIVIPTYKEIENIGKIIPKILSFQEQYHILIVDDGSPDGTAERVKEFMQEYPGRVHIIERQGKQGLGTAYIAGFKWALQHSYEYIFEMDADFSHNPNDLVRLYNACANENYDVAVGSRYVKGGKVVNWPWQRIFISRGGSFYVNLITWIPVKDTTAGFMCYKRKVLETINLDSVRYVGYAFQIEMKYKAWKNGFRIKEVPITFIDRIEGVSKMSKGIIKEAIVAVWKLKK